MGDGSISSHVGLYEGLTWDCNQDGPVDRIILGHRK